MQQLLDPSLAALTPAALDGITHGEVFTRPWVVELILDLAGYDAGRDLGMMTAVEPACGLGAFLGPMVARLSKSCRTYGRSIADIPQAIHAVDLLAHNVATCRQVVTAQLIADGWSVQDSASAAKTWIHHGDYLLGTATDVPADFVLGNPPYIRLEDVPMDRMAAYRAACPSMVGRSDVYIGFYDVGLRSLRPEGILGFICADRWMRNQYGRHLRQLIGAGFSVDATIVMHDVDAFTDQVSAYPAISILRRGHQAKTVLVEATKAFLPDDGAMIADWVRQRTVPTERNDRFEIATLPGWFSGKESWPSGSPSRLALIEDLNERFPALEDSRTGTRVGIGVATGADSVFLTRDAELDVEADRLLPLSTVADTVTGSLDWTGHYLVNPWDDRGQLVELNSYPRLRAYFQRNARSLTSRHVTSKRPMQWYRTIDKVDRKLSPRTKLLIPDLKSTIHPVLDEQSLYPHHNLYYIISDVWDMRVLGGLLLSKVAQAFVEAYAVRMRGGTLRFQAQYLRRIRVPYPDSIAAADSATLADAFDRRDVQLATRTALRIYGIDDQEGSLGFGSGKV